jgi:hypothetical protein
MIVVLCVIGICILYKVHILTKEVKHTQELIKKIPKEISIKQVLSI